jgi:hypothetical protein
MASGWQPARRERPLITGHCLCGEIRYEASSAPIWTAYCHCLSCRRATGALVAAYAGFNARDFRFISGKPACHESSTGVQRRFCPRCGTPLTYESVRWPGEVHLLIGSADDLKILRPQMHVYTEHQVHWLEIDDDLPRRVGTPEDD